MPDSIAVIVAMAGITFASRLLPFLLFSRTRPPRWVATVESVLPPLVLWLLVFYSLSKVSWLTSPFGIPSLAGVASVIVVYRWRHSTLLGIISGTAVYMALTRLMA